MIPFSSTTADTWGIPSGTFLGGYTLLAIAVFTATILVRLALGSGHARRDNPWLHGTDAHTAHLAAYLSGGADLAVLSALSSLRAADTLVASGASRCVRTAVPTDRTLSALESVVLAETATPISRAALVRRPAVANACRDLHSELVERGLLVSDERRRALRIAVLPLFAVLVLGVLRIVAGVMGGKAVSFIVLLTAVVAVAVYLLMTRVPIRSWRGNRNLERLRRDHSVWAPLMRPSWTANGPASAALAVGVFGAHALWTADPGFAKKMAVDEDSASGWGGSSWGGSSWGGSSWGGGSCGSGSSCGGGGGGCGGGCGG